jgi:hypothetical protein
MVGYIEQSGEQNAIDMTGGKKIHQAKEGKSHQLVSRYCPTLTVTTSSKKSGAKNLNSKTKGQIQGMIWVS